MATIKALSQIFSDWVPGDIAHMIKFRRDNPDFGAFGGPLYILAILGKEDCLPWRGVCVYTVHVHAPVSCQQVCRNPIAALGRARLQDHWREGLLEAWTKLPQDAKHAITRVDADMDTAETSENPGPRQRLANA